MLRQALQIEQKSQGIAAFSRGIGLLTGSVGFRELSLLKWKNHSSICAGSVGCCAFNTTLQESQFTPTYDLLLVAITTQFFYNVLLLKDIHGTPIGWRICRDSIG